MLQMDHVSNKCSSWQRKHHILSRPRLGAPRLVEDAPDDGVAEGVGGRGHEAHDSPAALPALPPGLEEEALEGRVLHRDVAAYCCILSSLRLLLHVVKTALRIGHGLGNVYRAFRFNPFLQYTPKGHIYLGSIS